MFYTSLGRLLMVDLGEDEERFQNFMLPLTGRFFQIYFCYYRYCLNFGIIVISFVLQQHLNQ